MYKISVPIMNATVTSDSRPVYAQLLREARVDRIFLCVTDYSYEKGELRRCIPSLRENVAYFQEQGFETALWVSETIGHGSSLSGVKAMYSAKDAIFSPLVDLEGTVRHGTHCPTDPAFRRLVASFVAELATTGAGAIMLDDDFRMSNHGPDPCCACEAHLRAISRICGEPVTREKLKQTVIAGKPNRYRDAWLQAQGDFLKTFAREIREAVDEKAPHVPVIVCSAPSHWWVDGVDTLELNRILAGSHAPEARLYGSPYWPGWANAGKGPKPLCGGLDVARMMAGYCRDRGVTVMAEGDVYPRPRYNVPSSLLELFDFGLCADGNYDGLLKYMVDYVLPPQEERGYLCRHTYNLEKKEAVGRAFSNGANCGVYVRSSVNGFREADLELCTRTKDYIDPVGGMMCGLSSIPTVYFDSNRALCSLVFGSVAETIQLAELDSGAILDATAAILLTRRGVDVGLDGIGEWESGSASFLIRDGRRYIVRDSGGRFLRPSLRMGAMTVEFASVNAEDIPFAYRYENAAGQRFFVYLFDQSSLLPNTGLFRAFGATKTLHDGVEWVSRRPLPVTVHDAPWVYVLCEKTEEQLSVLLLNYFPDSVIEPVLTLDEEYQTADWIGCSGRLEGKTVRLSGELSAYGVAAFTVRKGGNNGYHQN